MGAAEFQSGRECWSSVTALKEGVKRFLRQAQGQVARVPSPSVVAAAATSWGWGGGDHALMQASASIWEPGQAGESKGPTMSALKRIFPQVL